ncbi:hypothetical protein ACFV4X_12765 [Streptomyces ardesiacus]|uniref:hypothetical protein n=1 Tax=Streptomyces ardesiacus TaxID=285564 RepID=UPI003656F381
MEKESEDLRAALHPETILNATRQILRSAARWTTAEKGETVNRLFAWLGLVFVCSVLAYHYPWWALAAVPGWLLLCGGMALQNPALQRQSQADGKDHARTLEEEEGDYADVGDDFYEESDQEAEWSDADTDDQDHESGESDGGAVDPQNSTHEKAQAWWTLVEREVATAVHHGTKGVRIGVLLQLLQDRGHLRDWDELRLVALLRSIEIPVRDQMYFKIDGRKSNKPGVHVEDLTEALGRAPRLPAHLVPDLTPHQAPARGPSGALSLVKDEGQEEVA